MSRERTNDDRIGDGPQLRRCRVLATRATASKHQEDWSGLDWNIVGSGFGSLPLPKRRGRYRGVAAVGVTQAPRDAAAHDRFPLKTVANPTSALATIQHSDVAGAS